MTVSANKIYRDGSKLLRCTGESPPQFNGVLFITLEGETPDAVTESVRTVEQLRGLQGVEASTLSVQWKKALGLPEAKPSPKRQSTRRSSPTGGGRRATPAPKQVVETQFLLCSPKLGWYSLNFYIGLAILVNLSCGPQPIFTGMMIGMSGFAVVYALCSTFLGGTVKHGQIRRDYVSGF